MLGEFLNPDDRGKLLLQNACTYELHDFKGGKIGLFIVTAVRNSNPTSY
jgi:hypothetical protein